MPLRQVQVTDFRCLHRADVELDPDFTLIQGPNASGKTSLLEAIYFLGRGRSFRTRSLEHVIRTGADQLRVVGEVEVSDRRIPLGIEAGLTGTRAKVGGSPVSSLVELAVVLPVQIIDPEVHRLIEEGPSHRRRFVDWGVFHVEPGFVTHWRKYHHVLRQRNAALRSGASRSAVVAWDRDLVGYGVRISEARARYVSHLGSIARAVSQELLDLDVVLDYRPGWPRDVELGEALERSWRPDQEYRSTRVGPHRADLHIRLGGLAARNRVSRGQQKLLAAALLISQLKLFPDDAPARPTLLLDDPAAELDGERLAALMGLIRSQPLQLVVTTLHADLAAGIWGTPGRRFRLARGVLHPA